MNNLLNNTSEKEKDFAFGEKIIRTKPLEYDNGLKNYFCCSEPVTFRGRENNHIITDEFGALAAEFSDNYWVEIKDIMRKTISIEDPIELNEKPSLKEWEGSYIIRKYPLKIWKDTLNSSSFATIEPHKFCDKYINEPALLLKATENYLVVIFRKEMKILDSRYTNIEHWEKIDDSEVQVSKGKITLRRKRRNKKEVKDLK